MDKKRIVLVDDHDMVREGFKIALQNTDKYEIAGEASDGKQAIELIANLRPDIVIMDIDMPGVSGIQVAKKIRESDHDVKILILTMLSDEDLIFEALSAAVDGYIYKMAKMSVFRDAVECLAEGGTYFSQEVTNIIIGKKIKERAGVKETRLTSRELEILKLVVSGKTSQEIADQLFLSYHTVATHRKNIGDKLKIKNTADLIKFALNKGLF